MSLIRTFLRKITSKPPVIETPWGPVTEAARKQAAINMRGNAVLQEQVRVIIEKQMNVSSERAFQEMKRRYPEAFE